MSAFLRELAMLILFSKFVFNCLMSIPTLTSHCVRFEMNKDDTRLLVLLGFIGSIIGAPIGGLLCFNKIVSKCYFESGVRVAFHFI